LKVDWCLVRDDGNVMLCLRCGGERRIQLPCPLSAWALYAKAFQHEHQYCKPAPGAAPMRGER
jgi:hypothetical protein